MPFDGAGFDPVVQTLRGAEDIVVRRGWIQRAYGVTSGPRCVVGAIQEASEAVAGVLGMDAADKVARWNYIYNLRWDAGYFYGTAVGAVSIEPWQDQPERTLEEVREGFRLAIERAAERVVA